MSLQYVIDGYNIIHHPRFAQLSSKGSPQASLIALIGQANLCGSKNNSVTIVFDGYSPGVREGYGIRVIFSQDEEADARINQIVQRQANPKTLVIVSDDKQIRIFAKAFGASVLGIEEFLSRSDKLKFKDNDKDEEKLNYSQMQKVNEELRKIWLGG